MTYRKEVLAEGVEVYLGDCLEVLPTLGAFDAVVTDPPYGIGHRRGAAASRTEGRNGGKVKSIGFAGMHGDDRPFDPTPFLEYPSLMWGANYFAGHLQGGRWLIWDKVRNGGAGDFSDAEIAWCSQAGATRTFHHMWMGIQRDSQAGEARQHPTEKPVALLEWCIGFFPNAMHILDPYMGSGTTGIAAVRLGRKFTGVEIDPEHFATACRRIEAATREPDMFISPPKPIEQTSMFSDEAA